MTKDFISFILSEDGQAVVEENGYISQGNTGAFKSTEAEGKIVVAGSFFRNPCDGKAEGGIPCHQPQCND